MTETSRLLVARLVDVLLAPFFALSCLVMKLACRIKLKRMPVAKSLLLKIGVWPILDHYYEPRFNYKTHDFSDEPRDLPGLNLCPTTQLDALKALTFCDELLSDDDAPLHLRFLNSNPNFGPDDAAYWYSVVRAFKPRRIVEIGSGHSTLMALRALRRNAEESPDFSCDYTCIEPYEMPWLAKAPVKLLRKPVEQLPVELFSALEDRDFLFIDSSHMVRPGGDVLFELLTILPTLKPGVVVHIHDVWLYKEICG